MDAIKFLESDLAGSFLLNDFLEITRMDIFNQGANIQESIEEVLSEMTKTFTVDDKRDIANQTGAASPCANAKFSKYFDQEDGIYPSFNFMKVSHYIYPTALLGFAETVQLNNIQGLKLVSSGERRTYRIKARQNFTSKFQNDIF